MIEQIHGNRVPKIRKERKIDKEQSGFVKSDVYGERCSKKIKIESCFISQAATYTEHSIIGSKEIDVLCEIVVFFFYTIKGGREKNKIRD